MKAMPPPPASKCGPSEYLRPKAAQMPAEFLQTVHLEGEVREIRLDVHRAARRITTQLSSAPHYHWRFQEHQFRAARGFVAAHFRQTQYLPVEPHRPFRSSTR